ncbi:uncharacterized protein AB675_3576 [Cyphellophora attinorum]|uniref:T6SS Phospholipase effector Tle1-like catalytic domain-containing protein n=1 Tax=Cyphellophora attinorum TaxID=1664694 RepID=A0A0N1H8L1_9EURO|nr:uncharacterized protein AB675_3576 [Phialophora attinorum]KPI39710.1 hypothetical protein AB675_3576 [Phialophora attinorum]
MPLNDQRWMQGADFPEDCGSQLCAQARLECALIPDQIPRTLRAVTDSESSRNGRTIVVCLDGTGDQFDGDNTNIVHLTSCLKKDAKSQLTYYQAGVGTYSTNGLITGFVSGIDAAIGSFLGLHLRDAYSFIVHSYKEGDKICLFGFSRGAYTARCLAGMIHKVGLLPPRNVAQIPFAYEIYKNDSPAGYKTSAEFKKTFCNNVDVYFLGLFDTVDSVGLMPRELPFNAGAKDRCRFFRHALALDERRAKFQVRQYYGIHDWARKPCNLYDIVRSIVRTLGAAPPPEADTVEAQLESPEQPQYHVKHSGVITHRPDTDVLEVWFAGHHSNVGGGAWPNAERHKMSNIPLRWLIRQCFECNTGIIFNTDALAEQGIDVHLLWPRYQPLQVPTMESSPFLLEQYSIGLPPKSKRSQALKPFERHKKKHGFYSLESLKTLLQDSSTEWLPEQIEDCFDALAADYNALQMKKLWWILEIWPVQFNVWNRLRGAWESFWGLNLAQPRPVHGAQPLLHWTVRYRMLNLGISSPARMQDNAVWKIVA